MPKFKNKSIAGIIAAVLGKKELTVKDGKYELSQEERAKIENIYGKDFLDAFEASAIDEDGTSIFESMVNAAKAKDKTIADLNADKAELQKTVNTLAAEPEPTPAPRAVAPANSNAVTFKLNAGAKHNILAAQALASSAGFAAVQGETAVSLNTGDLNEEFGAVMPPSTRIEVLSKRIYNGFNDAKYFRRITSNTDYKASAAIMSEVSQQFTPKWTPKGSAKFTPVVIKYRRHKINVLLNATDILKSWLSYLYEQGKTQMEMPIIKYIIEQHILPKVTDDIVLSMIAKGEFKDHDDGTVENGDAGFAAKDSMDGIETILVNGKSDSKCKFNFFKNAADYTKMTAQQLLDYVDSFVDAISPLFARIFTVHCSPEFLTAYRRADFAVNGKYTNDMTDGEIRFTHFKLAAMESMYNSKIIFATPSDNLVMLVDYAKAENCINMIQAQDYDVKIFGEYSLSVGFLIAEAVYAAVPDGYDPQAVIASNPLDVSDA